MVAGRRMVPQTKKQAVIKRESAAGSTFLVPDEDGKQRASVAVSGLMEEAASLGRGLGSSRQLRGTQR